MAGFVRWASEQVEIYAETFRRQVYGADQNGKVIDESLEVTKAHGAMVRLPSVLRNAGCTELTSWAPRSSATSASTLPSSSTASFAHNDRAPHPSAPPLPPLGYATTLSRARTSALPSRPRHRLQRWPWRGRVSSCSKVTRVPVGQDRGRWSRSRAKRREADQPAERVSRGTTRSARRSRICNSISRGASRVVFSAEA